MGDLRLKVRNKIYTSGNHIVDTKNNNNAIVVFLGEMSSENLKPYIDNFLADTLKSQISNDKISFVQADNKNINELPELLSEAVKNIRLKSNVKNELFISFVTIMDDDLYSEELNINVAQIEEMKISALGGYSVEIFYDFYGIFVSSAKYSNRLNARKTVLNFLNKDNGGVNIRKRIYHQACPGGDYYRSAKSVTFMILINLIAKINQHTVLDSKAEGNCYTWTTFALFEKNLAALVIYEMIDKLLENQVNGVENVSPETISKRIRDTLMSEEIRIKKIASINDYEYIPILVRKTERKLSVAEKILNIFRKNKINPIELRRDNEETGIADLLKQQQEAIDCYIEDNITDEYCDALITDLISLCTVMSSINNNQNEGLILSSLTAVKKELLIKDKSNDYQTGYYAGKYSEMLSGAEAKILDRITDYFIAHINSYVETVQKHWNEMNMEVNNLINDFAAFQNYFEGIGDLIRDKTINLLCSYDDLLEKIDVQSVIKAINNNTEIYSNILSSYYDNVRAAGDIAQKFGNRNIVPDLENVSYYLFTATNVVCPGKLKLISDDYWFRDHEIAILFTAKNNIDDCDNLPFQI